MSVTLKSQGTNFKLYIDNTLHIYLDCNRLLSIQSWISSDGWYYIEFNGCGLKASYDNKKLWKEILRQLDKLDLFVKHNED